MERYHIYKLGLAIMFYAVYCRRPMFASGLGVDDVVEKVSNATGVLKDDGDYYVYYQGVQGTPGVDFPVYSAIPRTTFNCRNVEPGYYADLETDCQVFHICNDGRKISFLCPNGTVFQQSDLICEWWFKVNCTNSPHLYEESAEQLREETLRRKAAQQRKVPVNTSHGAVMRTEEVKTVTTSTQQKVMRKKVFDTSNNRNVVENTARQKGGRAYDNENQNYNNNNNGNRIDGNSRQNSRDRNRNTQQQFSNQQRNQEPSRGRTTFNSNQYQQTQAYNQVNSDTQGSDGNNYNTNSNRNQANSNDQASVNTNYNTNSNRNQANTNNQASVSTNYNSNANRNQGNLNNQASVGTNYNTNANRNQANSDTQSFVGTNYNTNANSNQANSNNNNQASVGTNYNTNSNRNQANSNNQASAGTNYNTNANHNQANSNNQASAGTTYNTNTNRNQANSDTQSFVGTNYNPNANRNQANSDNQASVGTNYNTNTNRNQVNSETQGSVGTNYKTNDNRNQQAYNNNFQNGGNNGNLQFSLNSNQGAVNIKKTTGVEIVPANLKFRTKIVYKQPVAGTASSFPAGNEGSFTASTPAAIIAQIGRSSSTVNIGQGSGGNNNQNQYYSSTIGTNAGTSSNDGKSSGNNVFVVPNSFFQGNTNEKATSNAGNAQNNNGRNNFDYQQNNYQQSGNGREQTTESRTDSSSKTNEENNNYNFIGLSSTVSPVQVKFSSTYSKNSESEAFGSKHQSSVSLTLNDIRNRKLTPNEADEAQITQETASFYKNSLNNLQQNNKQSTSRYPNHRETYSEIRDPKLYYGKSTDGKHVSTTISSISSQGLSSQPINNGQPFVGPKLSSTVGNYEIESSTKSFSNIGGSGIQSTTFRPFGGDSSTTSAGIYNSVSTIIGCCPDKTSKTSSNISASGNVDYYGDGYVNITVPRSGSNYVKVNKNKNDASSRTSFVTNSIRPDSTTQRGSKQFNSFTDSKLSAIPTGSTGIIRSSAPVASFSIRTGANKIPFGGAQNSSLNGYHGYQVTTPTATYSSFISPTSSLGTSPKVSYNVFSTTARTPFYSSTPNNFQQRSFSSFGNQNGNKNFQFSTVTPYNQVSSVSSKTTGFDNQYTTATPFGSKFPFDSSKGFYVTKSTPFGTQSVQSSVIPSSNSFFSGASTTNYFGDRSSKSFFARNDVLRPKPFELPSTYAPTSSPFSNRPFSSLAPPPHSNYRSTTPTPLPNYKISTASPFAFSYSVSDKPTQPTPQVTPLSIGRPFENVDSMITALRKIAPGKSEDRSSETPRPGLVIPPSAGPQTLHTLAVYFANALDDIVGNNETLTTTDSGDARAITTLLTTTTVNRYNELFKEKAESTTIATRTAATDDDSDLEGQHSKNPVQTTPRVRQLAKVFTQALSAYLDDPDTFKKVLHEVRPTEPPPLDDSIAGEEDEVLNFSDADVKVNRPPIFPTTPSLSASPTWGYLLAFNNTNNLDVKNSINPESENLQGADSQSFVTQFNSLTAGDKKSISSSTTPTISNTAKQFVSIKTDTRKKNLPNNHWTSSPDVAKLWQTTLSVNPIAINSKLDTTEAFIDSSTEASTEIEETGTTIDANSFVTNQEIRYDLRSLPKIDLNATQVHGLLIDFMNSTEESNRLQRILKRLNTSENEFLTRMKEIESNPLTRRLILLLISECGVNATKEIEARATPLQNVVEYAKQQVERKETLQGSSSNSNALATRSNSSLKQLVDPSLDEDEQDARALQLLNSLYTIASRWGK